MQKNFFLTLLNYYEVWWSSEQDPLDPLDPPVPGSNLGPGTLYCNYVVPTVPGRRVLPAYFKFFKRTLLAFNKDT